MKAVRKKIAIIIFSTILIVLYTIPNIYSTDNIIEDNYTYEESKFIYGNSSSKYSQEYEEIKSNENSKWGSLTSEQIIKENKKLKQLWQELKLTSEEISNKYPKGSLVLNNLTNNSGENLDIGNIESLFNIKEQKELRDTYINKNMRAAEYFTKDKEEAQFALEYEYHTKLGDKPRKTFFHNASYIDWYLATIGSFEIGTNATVTKTENNYTMILEFKESDYYHCNEKLYIGKFNSISKANMQNLHSAGLIKNFESYGTYKIKVAWEENQAVSDATIVEYKEEIE